MIAFGTTTPNHLLSLFREAIRKGHITTWTEHEGFFTHTPPQWYRKAWLRPVVSGNELRFAIVPPKDGKITDELYAIYHGRLIEAMLAHFDEQFSSGTATAKAVTPDVIAA